jgi:prepilin-type N-terminal cleavage/methylation domain-containing protein
MKKGFTLIELLAVIAIIAILAIVVVLTINPAVLLQQGRDATRVSDMGTLNKAVSLYYQDAMASPSTLFMGTSSVIYISVPDPTATSTAGNQCQGIGLPTPPTGYTYHCAASSTYMSVNNTGWIPINFNSYSAGSVISKLPVDPVNTTSTNLYYTYTTDGIGGFKLTSFFESKKDAPQMGLDSGIDPALYEKGSNLTLASGRGLIGYWSMDEGTGTSTIDYSGNNDTGTWHGTASGTSGYYSPGIVGPWAGTFNGVNDYAAINNLTNLSGSQITITLWFKGSFADSAVRQQNAGYITVDHSGQDILSNDGGTAGLSDGGVDDGIWHFMAMTWNQNTTNGFCTYKDGTLVAKRNSSNVAIPNEASPVYVGSMSGAAEFTNGLVDDVRIYDRALSAAEIQEIYNAEN